MTPRHVPAELFATVPLPVRDAVRLLVATPESLQHSTFADLGEHLAAGDLVVVNTSGTLPAGVVAHREDGRRAVVHFSTPLPTGEWVVELRSATRDRVADGWAGERVTLPHGVTLTLREGWPGHARSGSRLWSAQIAVEGPVSAYLAAVGRPIRYGYVDEPQPLAAYQTVFARDPGSAEMPSAGRPFTADLVVSLVARGIVFAPLTLHTGVSSLESGETPLPERFVVPAPTARLVNQTRAAGGRIVAVGTTVTRALETVADEDGVLRPGAGWTDLVLGPDRPGRVVDGLITGWHDAEASHLLLLQAVAGRALVDAAYDTALAARYRWHEFGDSCLLLP